MRILCLMWNDNVHEVSRTLDEWARYIGRDRSVTERVIHDLKNKKIADVKSEAGGIDLNKDQLLLVDKLEIQKEQVVSEAQSLFPDYK